MIEDKGKPTLPIMRRVILLLIISSSWLFLSDSTLADEGLLPPDHGYMLIRVKLTSRERVGLLAMTNLDTNDVIRVRTKSFEPAGANAWMTLVAMAQGRYFWSEFEPIFGVGTSPEEQFNQINRRYRRDAPSSAGDTFEIVSGVVNYIGDWRMRIVTSQRMRLDPSVDYHKTTLEQYLVEYPDNANMYEIYLSVMGKEAISLDELAKMQEAQSDSS